MERKKLLIFDAKLHDRELFSRLNGKYQFSITYIENPLSEETVRCAAGFSVVCVFVNDRITDLVIEALYAGGTRLIALRCAGCDNVDLGAAAGKIKVVHVPAYSPSSVAEHAIGMMLCINRKLHRAAARTRDNNFSIEGLMGFDMRGKVAGIVGAGKIGSEVIEILRAFGMHVLAYDVDAERVKKSGAELVELEQLLKKSDIISLHCNLSTENHHLFDQKAFGLMKQNVIFINTARGGLVDAEALLWAIQTQRIGAAGIDVYEHEANLFYTDVSATGIADDVLARLLSYPQVLVTAHQAFFTHEAVETIVTTTCENVDAFYAGRALSFELTQ